MTVYFYYGQEDFNIEQEIKKHKKTLDKNFLAMNYKSFDNPNFPTFVEALRSQPMMFGKMLVVINCLDYFSKTLEDKQLEEIKVALDNNSENVDIILTAILDREGTGKLDSRRKFTKLLMKYNAKEFPQISVFKPHEVVYWVKNQAKNKKLSIDNDAAELLVENLSNNLRLLDNEIEKMGLSSGEDKKITKEIVKENSITTDDFLEFTNFLMKNKRDEALLKFYRITEKRHPLELLAGTNTMLRKWILIKLYGKTKGTAEAARIIGMNEFRAKMIYANMKDTPLKDLIRLKENFTRAESRIKNFEAFDEFTEIQNVIMG